MRLEAGLLLDRVGLGRDVALHGAALVGEERLRIGGVGLHLRLAEAEVGLEPLEVAREPLARDEQRELLEVLELLDALVRDAPSAPAAPSGTWRRPRAIGMFCSTASKLCSVFAAHEEVDLADRQQDAVVHVRPARHDGDVEAVLSIGAVGQRLVDGRRARPAPPSWCRTTPCRAAAAPAACAPAQTRPQGDCACDALQQSNDHHHLVDNNRRFVAGWAKAPGTMKTTYTLAMAACPRVDAAATAPVTRGHGARIARDRGRVADCAPLASPQGA